MVFLNLRQRTDSVQALLSVAPDKVSKQMAKWAAGLQIESIVLAEGIVKKAPEIIKSATVGDVELHLTQVCHISVRVILHVANSALPCSYTLFLGWRLSCPSRSTMPTGQSPQRPRQKMCSSSACYLTPV